MNTATNDNFDPSILKAMMHQEQAYVCDDYLYQNDPQEECIINGPLEEAIEKDRAKMVGWQYQVSDFCNFNRETVAIATSYFDRFLSTKAGDEALGDTDLFQLAAMSCFYTAAKIHEPESFEPWMLSKMSRGLYSAEQVEKMEVQVLEAIGWRMNPPTALAFVREFLAMLPECYVTHAVKPAVYDLCKFQTELCVRMYEFVPYKASTIAVAALMNALESMGMDCSTLGLVEELLARSVQALVNEEVQNSLYQAVTEYSGIHKEASTNIRYPAKQTLCNKSSRRASFQSSPRAVQIMTTA